MQTISLKIADSILTRIDDNLEHYNYSTRSEFIRDAIRDKLTFLENQKVEAELGDYLHKTTKNRGVVSRQDELEKAKNDIFVDLERKFNELREHLN